MKTILGEFNEEKKLSEISVERGIFENKEEFFEFIRNKAREFSEKRLKEINYEDRILIEEFKLLNLLQEFENRIKERFRSSEFFLEKDSDLDRDFSYILNFLGDKKKNLEKRVKEKCDKIIPNLSKILGVNLSCQILSHAGSLEKLAKMPSSTIQILGAEKALFRYLKGKGTSPKHGILFLSPFVRNLSKDKRGSMARFLSNKVSLAAKIDFYRGEFRGNELLKEIKEKYRSLRG